MASLSVRIWSGTDAEFLEHLVGLRAESGGRSTDSRQQLLHFCFAVVAIAGSLVNEVDDIRLINVIGDRLSAVRNCALSGLQSAGMFGARENPQAFRRKFGV
ncbi:hypothetical protein A5906_33635 [Bradyrhizobium sacchari]|nr:hypothetical protein A5906_33635 [Bradyrhizobium sacchari]